MKRKAACSLSGCVPILAVCLFCFGQAFAQCDLSPFEVSALPATVAESTEWNFNSAAGVFGWFDSANELGRVQFVGYQDSTTVHWFGVLNGLATVTYPPYTVSATDFGTMVTKLNTYLAAVFPLDQTTYKSTTSALNTNMTTSGVNIGSPLPVEGVYELLAELQTITDLNDVSNSGVVDRVIGVVPPEWFTYVVRTGWIRSWQSRKLT